MGIWRGGAFLLEALLLGSALAPFFRFAAAASRNPRAEAGRWICLIAASLALTLPYARPERVGAGDAQDYAEHLADFIAQTHEGGFPVLVGQSRFAFNGAFNPLRTAPYFQYLGGLLGTLTFGQLGPFALQNLEIILSLLAAAFTSYLCLRRLAPGRGWFCLLLAALYVSSPGVLALAYSGDMIPSWLTLPYLPLYAYLFVRIAEAGISGQRLAALAVTLAAIWTAHAPIAMWLTFLAIPVIGLRLIQAYLLSWRRAVLVGAVALAIFALLAGYEFVSVLELRLPGIPPHPSPAALASAHEILNETWLGFFRPVSASAADLLSDLQLSAGIWICLLVGSLGWKRGGWGLRALTLAAVGLLLLLAPLPAVSGRIWQALPGWVGRITDQWPGQRFFPILSGVAPFAALLACERAWLGRPRVVQSVVALLAVWSGWEARKFLQHGYRVAAPPALSRRLIRGQSTVLSVYSYAMLAALPRYFSYGPVKPDLQLHLLDADSLEIADTNQRALLSGRVASQKTWTLSLTPVPGGAVLQQELQLPAGQSFLLLFNFKGPPEPGTLVISGRNFWREYQLPASGGELAFGVGGNHSSAIGLHVPSGLGDESVGIRYVASNGPAARPVVADLGVVAYSSTDLPFRLVSLLPYRLEVNAPRGGWLETPRIFIPGYQASLDGHPIAPERSPDGLVMLRVPPGRSMIELRYGGTPLLRAAFWISFGGWLAFFGLVLARTWLPTSESLAKLLGRARKGYRQVQPQFIRVAVPAALAGFCLSTALLSYCEVERAQEARARSNQLVFNIHFPGGRPGDTVKLQQLANPAVTGTLLATYLDRNHVQLQFVQRDGTRSTSGALLVNFLAEQKIECGRLPGGVHCLFFNNRLIWRSDEIKLPSHDPFSESVDLARAGPS